MSRDFKKIIACTAVASTILTSFAGCSSNSNSSDTDSSTEASAEQLKIYLDSDGNPYYNDSDGNKMLLYAYSDDASSDDESSYIYDYYDDEAGLTFTIPDGWYADASYGYPYLFQDGDEEYNEAIALFPLDYVFEADDGVITEDTISDTMQTAVDDGTYYSYEISDSGEMSFGEFNATYYDVIVSYSEDEVGTDDAYKTKYIITDNDNPFCIMLISLSGEDSYSVVDDAFELFKDTITLPAAEETGDEDVEVEMEAVEEDTDETEDVESEEVETTEEETEIE